MSRLCLALSSLWCAWVGETCSGSGRTTPTPTAVISHLRRHRKLQQAMHPAALRQLRMQQRAVSISSSKTSCSGGSCSR
jgi:hypothetical protein